MVCAIASTTLVAWLELPTDAAVLVVLAVLPEGCCLCVLYRLLPVSLMYPGVVTSLFGIGGSWGLSGASVEADMGGGDRLPWRL